MKNILILVLLLKLSLPVLSQDKALDFFIVANANLYFPGNWSDKGVYPILGYNKQTDPKILVGGFGVGALAFRSVNEKFRAKGQISVSKQAYWDASQHLRDVSGDPLGYYFYSTSDYKLGFNATMHYTLTKKMMLGTGLGAQILLFSISRSPENLYTEPNELYANNYYKRIMPVVPLELSYKLNSVLLNLRYERALLNKFRGDLSDYKDERFGVLYFEVGFKL